MPDLGLPFRRLLVALFAAWLPLACCCRVLHAEASVPTGVEATEHACCSEAARDDGAIPVGETPSDECECDNARVAVAIDAPAAPGQPAVIGYLPFWGDADIGAASAITSGARPISVCGDSSLPAAPSLRALSVLLTI